MQRHHLRKRDVRELLERVRRDLPNLPIDESMGSGSWEVAKLRDAKVFIKDGVPLLIETEGRLIPSTYAAEACKYPRVVVDSGAVRPIVRGADVMAPGIRGVEGPMEAGDVVAVAEEEAGRVIAVGVALMSKGEVLEVRRGKALKVLHRVGDEAWRLGQAPR
ncbi:MAG: DUF1947 domain-containing protein [Candidatus Nezhaarchaeales archaeon]